MAGSVKIEWLAEGGKSAPSANLLLDGENIGFVYHEGISWTIIVRGQRRGGYASVRQMTRDAKRLWEAGQ